MTPLEVRLEQLKKDLGHGDPAKIALVTRVTVDAAGLQARAAAGEDVDREMAHVRASAANLDEHARQTIGRHLTELATEVLGRALGIALGAA